MITNLIDYFEQHIHLDEVEKQFIRENIPVKAIKKNNLLLKEGEISTEFYFIIKGAIRLFYTINLEEKNSIFLFRK